jgi:exonuclease III
MIVVSYNVRGLGGQIKRRKLRELVKNHNVDFLAIQETKLNSVSDQLCYSLWGSHDCEWAFLPAEGNSGGILSIWNKANSSLLFTFMGDGFVGVCLEWGVMKSICFVVNIYTKCNFSAKRKLWHDLLTVAVLGPCLRGCKFLINILINNYI